MGLMQKLRRRFTSVKEQLYRRGITDDSGDLVSETADFLVDARKEFNAIILDMEDDTLLSKMEILLELDMMIKAGSDLVTPLYDRGNQGYSKRTASRRAARAFVDLLRKIAIQCYFYIDFIKRNDGDIDRKFFQKLKEKGLLKPQDSEFVHLCRDPDDTVTTNPISEAKFARVLELRDLALMNSEQSSAFGSVIKHKVRSASNRMKGFVCLSDFFRSQSGTATYTPSDTPTNTLTGTATDLVAREKGDGLRNSIKSKLSDSDFVKTRREDIYVQSKTDRRPEEETRPITSDFTL